MSERKTVRAKVFAKSPDLRVAYAQTVDGFQYVVSAKWHGVEFFDSLSEGAEVELEIADDVPKVLSARLVK
jgi:hypothetical protein